MQIEELKKMIDKRYSIRRISRETGKAATTVRFWLDKYGLKTGCCSGRGLTKWTEEQMREAIAGSTTIADVLRKLGLTVWSSNYDTVGRFIRNQGIDVSHMIGKASGRGGNRIILEDIFVPNSRHDRSTIKRHILKNRVLKYKCAICGQTPKWKGRPLRMILDHINGVNNDNRIENLRLLCPNCNSQQDTFCKKKSLLK